MIDNISKFLIEQYSTDFAAWLLGESITLTTINPTELNVEPIRGRFGDVIAIKQCDPAYGVSNR